MRIKRGHGQFTYFVYMSRKDYLLWLINPLAGADAIDDLQHYAVCTRCGVEWKIHIDSALCPHDNLGVFLSKRGVIPQ